MLKISDFLTVKLLRVDHDNKIILVWHGGVYIKCYDKHGKEVKVFTIEEPVQPGWISAEKVKRRMQQIIRGGELSELKSHTPKEKI